MAEEFDVAVVVFCRAIGDGQEDASDRAERAVSQVLRNAEFLNGTEIEGQSVRGVAVRTLASAANGGFLELQPNARAFRQAGLGAPRRTV